MRIFASLRIALRALRRNKMRSLLTMLGIIIGVGAVIASVSLTSGATKQISDQVSSLGESVITVFSGNFTQGGTRGGWGSAPTLTVEDAEAIGNEVPNVAAVSPEVRDREQVLSEGLNWNTQVMGESPDYAQIRNWTMAEGSMFTSQDVRTLGKVAVVGKTVVDELFPDTNPLGQTIRIRDLPFKIVGVLAPKGFNLFGQDQDDVVIIPYTSHMRRITARTFVNDILVAASSDKAIDSVQDGITQLLTARHRNVEDFTVRNQLELMQTVTSTSRTMGVLLTVVAAVSLIVGGIGIMNIMLVSVTERTREIGIRMAVGARAADILIQFLIEAVTLSAIGGGIGIAGGMGCSYLLSSLESMPLVVPFTWIMISVVSSALIGVVSGFYPAWKASQLDPIEALRYE